MDLKIMESPDRENIETHAVPTDSIGSLLAAQAARCPDAVAIATPGRPALTYRKLYEQVREVGAALNSSGIGRNDRVAVTLPNGPEMAVTFLAVAAASTCAPLNPAYTATEFDFYLTDLKANAVIVLSGSDSPVRGVAKARGIPIIELSPRPDAEAGLFTLSSLVGPPSTRAGLAKADDVALVLHTSGTTSRPKIIPLSHKNLCTSAHNIRSRLQLTESDRCLNVMPLFHIHGLIGALLSSLATGASVFCTPGFSQVHFFQWMNEFDPTWYTAVPSIHQEVLAGAGANQEIITRSRLRFIRSSSSALPPKVMMDLEKTFSAPAIEAYGMTEASHQIASNPLPPAQRKMGSVGLPSGPKVAIINESGHPLPRGEIGEIAMCGANVTVSPPVTAQIGDTLGQGWIRTGDIGFLDSDGYLFISGRVKEMINRGGEKISPREIDEVLLEHSAVAQAVACAIPHSRLGEDVIAVVVRRPGATVSERELREFAATRLAPFKVPCRVIFVEQIPKGPTGKIQRIGLAHKLGVESLADIRSAEKVAPVAPRTAVETVLAEIWMEVLGIDQIDMHDNFFELGGDSLALANVVAHVERRLGVTINARQMAFGTLQQLAAACEETAQCHRKPKFVGWMRNILGRLYRTGDERNIG
jgi:acyl-CoA synthetase (AMP-forming)/AMP-acid ligase II/acyl carrier protein